MCACPCPCPWPCPWKFLDRHSLTRGVQMCACPCPRPCPRPCPWMWIAPCSHSVRVDCISRTHTRGFPTSTWFLYTLPGINMAAKRKPCRAWRLDDHHLEQLFILVQENECIYNPQDPDHKDAVRLANIWSSIAAKLAADNPELEGMTGE